MSKRPITRIVLVVGVLVAIAAAALVVLLPRWVKEKIIAAAAAQGVALTIDDLSIAPGRAQLKGVHASPLIHSDAKGAPKASADAQVVDVTLDGLTPTAVTVTGMAVHVDGDQADVRAALASRDKKAGAAPSIEKVTIKDASLDWKRVVSTQRVVIDAQHVNGEVTKDAWHLETKELRAFDKALPPWSLVADGTQAGTKLQFALPANAKATLDLAANGTRGIDLDTPNVTVRDLGVPPELLGLYGDETSHFELHVHHHERDPEHAEGTIVGTASNVFLGAATARTSFAIDAHYAGDPKTSMRINAGTLRAGPFTGAIEGGFAFAARDVPPSAAPSTDPAAGFKASLRYTSGVMSCVDAVKSQAASYGEIGKGVAALANMLGLDKAVEGRVLLKGEIEIDSRAAAQRFSFRTEGDCRLSYLPSL